MNDEGYVAAIHEAAHVIACIHLGVKVKAVTLDHVIFKSTNPESLTDESLRRDLIVRAAGGVAEKLFFGYEPNMPPGDMADLLDSDTLLKSFGADDAECVRQVKAARHEARSILLPNKSEVEIVAMALMQCGSLNKKQIATIVAMVEHNKQRRN